MRVDYERVGVGFMLFWALCFVLGLAFWGLVIYVALHFIGKFW